MISKTQKIREKYFISFQDIFPVLLIACCLKIIIKSEANDHAIGSILFINRTTI